MKKIIKTTDKQGNKLIALAYAYSDENEARECESRFSDLRKIDEILKGELSQITLFMTQNPDFVSRVFPLFRDKEPDFGLLMQAFASIKHD